jgi:phospholipid/cholesterol/gamma-HCH transport system ATP-binding protein
MNLQSGTIIRLQDVAVLHAEEGQTQPRMEISVHESEVIALLGPDARLLRKYLRNMVALESPSEGTVEVMGLATDALDRQASKTLRARIGYLIGDSTLLPIYNGLMNVMLPALYHHPERSFSAVSKPARTLLEELDCKFDVRSLPHLMSSFQQRQIQLARALILEPDILCMEEPFYDLSADDKRIFAEKLLKMRDKVHSKCIILTTDYLEFVSQFVDRIVFVGSQRVEVFPGWREFCVSRHSEIESYLEANL